MGVIAVFRSIDNNVTGLRQDIRDAIGTHAHRVLAGGNNGVECLIDEG
jgi:hypothetical protein